MAFAWMSESANFACNDRGLRHRRVLGPADDRHHLVDVLDGDLQAFQDVAALVGLPELVGGAAEDDFAAMLVEDLEQLLQVQDARRAVDQGDVVDAEGRLHRRQFVEVVEDDVAVFALFQVDDDTDPVFVRLVADVGDAFDALGVHELGDLFDQARFVDEVGDLADDDRFATGFL